MKIKKITLPQIESGKKIFFASDFHLGSPNFLATQEREKKIVRWLDEISSSAHAIFLLGDLFDFWFEYKYVIPKGFVRLQGKIAELTDQGIPVFFFTGNHDMWMFDYFQKELGVTIFHSPVELEIQHKKLLIGHGDGLGPGDFTYKIIKRFFENRFCQWLFSILPTKIGFGIATNWSKHSRSQNIEKDQKFLGEKEHLTQFCKELEVKNHYDYYIFGHRHLPLEIPISENSKYINIGEWISQCSYGVFENSQFDLKYY